jgi:predicted RNA-binding Zn-ribbon protein involved in translation (DUF1610 family)
MGGINKANPEYISPFVCVSCRKSFKRPWQDAVYHRPCPSCGNPAIQVSRKFKPPKADDLEQWEKVQLLIEHGFLFQSIYDDTQSGRNVPYPKTLKDAREWINKWAHKAIDVTTILGNV